VSFCDPVVVDAVGAPGVAGTVVTVIELDAADGADVPEELVAVTVNVGVDPVERPPTTIGEDDPLCDCPVLAVTV
jgi:hypothetical protein